MGSDSEKHYSGDVISVESQTPHMRRSVCTRLQLMPSRYMYVYVSLLVALCLTGTIVNDIIHYTFTHQAKLTTQNFTMALLVIHPIGLFYGLVAFIYISQSDDVLDNMAILSLFSIVLHIVLFTARVTLEGLYMHYRAERYPLASD